MGVQFYDNKVLFDGGAIAFHADCCCEEEINVPFGECTACCDDISDAIRIYAECWLGGVAHYVEGDAFRDAYDPCYFVGVFQPDPYCEAMNIKWCDNGEISLGLTMCIPGSSFYTEDQCIYPITELEFVTSPPTVSAIVSVGPATGEPAIC